MLPLLSQLCHCYSRLALMLIYLSCLSSWKTCEHFTPAADALPERLTLCSISFQNPDSVCLVHECVGSEQLHDIAANNGHINGITQRINKKNWLATLLVIEFFMNFINSLMHSYCQLLHLCCPDVNTRFCLIESALTSTGCV